jgi:DNA-binding MarR family transcriptional regulator
MAALSKTDFEARSEFRFRLTCFLRFGEQEAQVEGITFAHYLVLLHVKGMPGRSWALIGELAQRLQLRHQSTVGLVSRCEAVGLVQRRRSEGDRREVQIHLTALGERKLRHIAAAQTEELSALVQGLELDPGGALAPPDPAGGTACEADAASAKAKPRARRPRG